MKKTCVILDRDGVINQDSSDYIKSSAEWIPISGSLEAIALLNHKGYLVAVATNQSGIGRGLFSLQTLEAMHNKMKKQLAQLNGHIDYLAYCPHHPDLDCLCRKPKIGLLKEIASALQIDLNKSYFVGDTFKDMQAAKVAGCQGVLVQTGKGEQTVQQHPELKTQYPIYANLLAFVETL